MKIPYKNVSIGLLVFVLSLALFPTRSRAQGFVFINCDMVLGNLQNVVSEIGSIEYYLNWVSQHPEEYNDEEIRGLTERLVSLDQSREDWQELFLSACL